MASIREKKKGNKIISYEFTCCLARDAKGRQIRRYSTWTPKEGLSPSKERKAAERAAEAWEQALRKEYEKDLKSPERVAIKDIANAKMDFGAFVTEVWFPICIDNGEHKPKTVSFYNDTMKNIVGHFEGFALQNIIFYDSYGYQSAAFFSSLSRAFSTSLSTAFVNVCP